MTSKQCQSAAVSDPDARALTPGDFKRMKRTPRAKIIRRALGLTQQEFATPARAYLTVIARNPKAVVEALEPAS